MSLGLMINQHLYLVGISAVFLCVYFFFWLKVKSVKRSKLKSIKQREIFDAVETDAPTDEKLKDKGFDDIEARFGFISKALPIVLTLLWAFLAFIPYLGKVPTAYISIIAAVFSVIVGVSLRPFLENLFSGIIITFFKSIRIGDSVIIDDQYGLIEEVNLTYTVLKRWDWHRIVIPNSKLLNKEIQNLTMNDPYIWAHVEFYVAPDSDITQVEQLAKKAAAASRYLSGDEPPSFWVMGLEKEAIKCWVAAWAENPSDAWELRSEVRTNIFKSLQSAGIKLHQLNLLENLKA